MKKLLILALLAMSTSAFAAEWMNPWGVIVSNRCNGMDGSWWIYPPSWAIPVGAACHTPAGVPGFAGG